MYQRFQRVVALIIALALIWPVSVFAENRTEGRTDLERLAADLERIFGRGSVAIEPLERSSQTASRPQGTSAELSILTAMNRQRAARGLGPLRLNQQLSLAAADRVEDMFAKRYFAHVSPDGVQPFVWARRRGYAYRTIGENLALGYRGSAVVDGWMDSPGHRENILQRSFDEVGIAIAEGSPRREYGGPLVVAIYASR